MRWSPLGNANFIYGTKTRKSSPRRPPNPHTSEWSDMRDWPNPVFEGTLEQACAASPPYPALPRIALEVEEVDSPRARRYVLAAAYDVGLPPWTGDLARCS